MPVTILLISANILVFVLYLFKSSFTGFFDFDGAVLLKMGASFGPYVFLQHEYWRIPASLFLHANLQHIALNMCSLFLFGRMMEKAMGSLRFLTLYFFAGFFGALVSLAFHPASESVGASGAILGLVGFYLTLQFQLDKVAHPGAGYRVRQLIGLALALYCLSMTPGVDNAAHAGGIVAGIIGGGLFRKFADFKKIWDFRDFAVATVLSLIIAGGLWGEIQTYGKDQSLPAMMMVKDSLEALEKNDLATALSKLNNAIVLDPKNERAHVLRAKIYFFQRQYAAALDDANAAVAAKNDYGVAYNERAAIYLAMGRFDYAFDDAKKATSLDSDLSASLDCQAMALAYMGHYEQALEAINRAIYEDHGATGIYIYHRSLIYSAKGDQLQAEKDKTQATKQGYVLAGWERPLPAPGGQALR